MFLVFLSSSRIFCLFLLSKCLSFHLLFLASCNVRSDHSIDLLTRFRDLYGLPLQMLDVLMLFKMLQLFLQASPYPLFLHTDFS